MGSPNLDYYLTDNATSNWWWTLSPSSFRGNIDFAFLVDEFGVVYNYYNVYNDIGRLRPAVTLASSTVITGGKGTIGSPYLVG